MPPRKAPPAVSSEHEAAIRDIWRRCRNRALRTFDVLPEFHFRHEGHELVFRHQEVTPGRWQVICEGLEVERGAGPPHEAVVHDHETAVPSLADQLEIARAGREMDALLDAQKAENAATAPLVPDA